ncbi:MAG: MSHA biogenesis protein MshE [Pseudomonadales bacterium]|nr:MSHA biogenesis protein MshE [Pseudomonadales bacterium]
MLKHGAKIRIGDLLVDKGVISDVQLSDALAEQKQSGHKLGRILVDRGYVDEQNFLGFLSDQLGVPFVDLAQYQIDESVVALLPETYARRHRAIILERQGAELLVGMTDPIDIFAYDEVARQVDTPINIAVVREKDLLETLDRAYRRTGEIESFASELDGELSIDEFTLKEFRKDSEDSPVAKLLQSILEDAVQMRASDVHVEPGDGVLRLRLRVDGLLHEQALNEVRIAPALISRLKLMAGLDISEKRLPQDGRFEYQMKDRSLDVRLSTLPASHGESVVMRLVDHSQGLTQLDQVGMRPEEVAKFRRLIKQPHGLILVTGPTGSGKTTTLYGALRELNSSEKKIITVEDPVEIQQPRLIQVQVNSRIGLDFASVLRATLRQDPDILLVGEIRDRETAEIALRAAMTGHLVLSTLHTNDAVSSALRLMDIGIEGYMVAGSVRAIIGQRLVRKLCENCKVACELDSQLSSWINGIAPELKERTFYESTGCSQCGNSGHVGRIGVFELLEMTPELGDALRDDDAGLFSRLATSQPGYRRLVSGALEYAVDGVTSLAEAMAVSGHEEEVIVAPSLEATLAVAQAGREPPLQTSTPDAAH